MLECPQHTLRVQKNVSSKYKMNFIFLSTIATMFAEIQGENKKIREVKRSEANRRQRNGQT